MHEITDIFEQLESTSSRNDKEDILRRNKENDLLQRLLVAALDPYTTYGVIKYDKNAKGLSNSSLPTDLSPSERFEEFLKLLQRLSTREITGNTAKYSVISLMGLMTEVERKWAHRILIKNLRCGVQNSTVNKVWPGSVKPFAVALAETLIATPRQGGGFDIKDPVEYPLAVQPKLDGLRCVVFKEAGKVQMFTRNGSLLESAPTIKNFLEKFEGFESGVLDGELMARDWNESASIVMSSKNVKDDSTLVFHVFDIVSIDEWKAQSGEESQAVRRGRLLELFDNVAGPVKVVEEYYVENENSLREVYANCLSFGFEGVMLKDKTAPYVFKRHKSVLKFKPVSTWEGVVSGVYNGRLGGKRENLFGGFEVLLPNGIVTRVGSGFTDKLKADIQLDGPETYVGKIVELEGQPDPLSPDGLTRDGKIRFPVFVRFRDPSDVDQSVLALLESK